MTRMSKSACVLLICATAGLLSACGSSSSGGGGNKAKNEFNAGSNGIRNPSNVKGGTLNLIANSDCDYWDPARTYYSHCWNLQRLISRTLVTYAAAPGNAGTKLVHDLATSVPTSPDGGMTWTYHLKPGIRFEDGSTVTSTDVKYAVERTYARDVLPNGPGYFKLLLADSSYPGPHKDKTPDKMGLTSVTTPSAVTIMFHLQKPFADFDYVAALPQTVPVPPGKDTGANYQLDPVSTGPYEFRSYQLARQYTLVKNPEWDAGSDRARGSRSQVEALRR